MPETRPRSVLTLLKKSLWHRCFPVNFAKFLRTPPVAASAIRTLVIKLKLSVDGAFSNCKVGVFLPQCWSNLRLPKNLILLNLPKFDTRTLPVKMAMFGTCFGPMPDFEKS